MQVGAQVIADRYAYIPLLGLFVIVAWSVFPSPGRASSGPSQIFRGLAAVLVSAVLGFLTWRQVGFWESSVDLWSHTLDVTTKNSMAENFFANTLFGLGRYQEGMTHLRNYAAMEPLDPRAHARVGADDQDHGRLADAAEEFEAAIHASTVLSGYGVMGMDSRTLALTYANLGVTYTQLGDAAKAADNGRKGLDTDRQAIEQMLQQLSQAVGVHPTAAGYVRLGLLLQLFGRVPEAQEVFARARQLDPYPPGLSSADQTTNSAQAGR